MRDRPAFDFRGIEVLTFDCYGTLIDWEAGLLAGLRRIVGGAQTDDSLLEAYARAEAGAERGRWRPYREVLAVSLVEVCRGLGITPTAGQARAFGDSVEDWPAFPDSKAALARLREQFELAVITNCDDDLFAASGRRLGQPFSWVITAEQARSYKPSLHNFELALARAGRPRSRLLHVAQSLYHDHVPAKQLGLATAWIDRRRGRPGFGATPPAGAKPDVVAPDMASFAAMALDG